MISSAVCSGRACCIGSSSVCSTLQEKYTDGLCVFCRTNTHLVSGAGATAPPQADGGFTVPGSVPTLWTGFSQTASDPRTDCSLSVTNTGQIHDQSG